MSGSSNVAASPPGAASFRVAVLPWTAAAADERRFRRILRGTFALLLLAGIALPWVTLPPPPRVESQPLPPPLARLLIERRATTEAPRPAKPTAAPARPSAAPAQAGTAAGAREARPNPSPQAGAANNAAAAVETARRQAAASGLLAMKDELADLTRAPTPQPLRADPHAAAAPQAAAGPADSGQPLRAMITAAAGRGSGGIATDAVSRGGGGGGTGGSATLAGRSTTRVEGRGGATVAPGGGAGGHGGSGGTARGSGHASRPLEDIKLVFERNKGAIYALYTRALRDDPALHGKVVVELTISPGGQVSEARIVSSELHADELERKLLARIRLFDFGAREVEPLVLTWPLDFLPS
ncbi:MAG: AgmX/PglI C-terminal domain-containing protein [Burkholderiales bacterium]|nr:AgmX/PglI C-terminal domain-containing protein [Burkholderiales bacterium]